MKLNDYLELKETYEKKKLEQAKIQGELDSLFKIIQEEHNIKTLEELEVTLEEIKKFVKKQIAKFDKEVDKLEKEINGQET